MMDSQEVGKSMRETIQQRLFRYNERSCRTPEEIRNNWGKQRKWKEPKQGEVLKPRIWGSAHMETEGIRTNTDYLKGGRGCLGG